MTNAALQALFDEYGARVKVIKCSCHQIMLNQKIENYTLTNDDIKFITKGGVDMIAFKDYNGITHKYDMVFLKTSDIVKLIITDDAKDPVDCYRI